jgi:hypothetical protein
MYIGFFGWLASFLPLCLRGNGFGGGFLAWSQFVNVVDPKERIGTNAGQGRRQSGIVGGGVNGGTRCKWGESASESAYFAKPPAG